MKKQIISRSIVGAGAALTIAALALTGCTPSHTGDTDGGPGANNLAPARTYSESDLVTILTSANTHLQANGTVSDDGLMKDAPATKTQSLSQRIATQGGTMTPAGCGALLDKFTHDALTFNHNDGAYSATLTYGTTVLSATSAAKPGNTAALAKLISSDVDAMDAKCSSMKFTFSAKTSAQYSLTFTKGLVKTAAGLTPTYTEVTSSGASTVRTISGFAIDGNLQIGFAGISSATTVDDLVTGINAVYYAARE